MISSKAPSPRPPFKTTTKRSFALLFSIFLNITLAGLLAFFLLKERPPTPYCLGKPPLPKEKQVPIALDRTNSQVLRYFKTLSMERLISKLSNTELIEDGYQQRDLALGMLVSFHGFDVQRALKGSFFPQETRILQFGKREVGPKAEITVFPGLTDQSYEAIIKFAKQEKWPMTSSEIFKRLKIEQTKPIQDLTLQDTFFLTPEFLSIEKLFLRSDPSLRKQDILALLLEGQFELIATFTKEQAHVQDLSNEKRQKFLLDYLAKGSKQAAFLFLKMDPTVALKKLDDSTLYKLLELLDPNTKETQSFVLALLNSPRGNAVLTKAKSLLLTDKEQETLFPPSLVKKEENLPLEQEVLPKKTPPSPAQKEKIYIIQEGDSLWKISRRFKVNIDELKTLNHLTSDVLKPGNSLYIP